MTIKTDSKYVIDTDIFIDFLNGQSFAIEIFEAVKTGKIHGYFSILTEGELLSGCRNWQEQEKIDSLLSKLERLDISTMVIRKAAEYRRSYGKKFGTSMIDAIIAASAYCHEADLLTRNIKHYSPIKEIHLGLCHK
ncbi:type II toxin-antitoxin system VapC family toxin [Candidatus Saganbacteria bacterium]|nr:type II toxin-antitoxin system VapC family toxin [Candidatus Saganbacteria bacterium]